MSKRKFLFLYLGILTLISVIVIGSSSWLIAPRVTTDSGLNQSIDTSDYFAKELEFKKGTAQNSIGLTAEGIAIFGSGYKQNNNGTTGYTVSLTTDASMPGTYYYDNNVAITNSAHRGLVAGTHYYTITDNATGQVIAKNHQVVIKPVEFTVTVTNPTAPIFIGNTNAIATVKMVANDGAKTISFTHTFGRDDYTPSSTVLCSYSGEANLKNNSANTYKETDVPAFAAANATGFNSNNYALREKYEVAANILPKVKNADATPVYYADIVQALDKNMGKTATVIPMIEVSYTPEGATEATTYSLAKKNYTHVIDTNCTIDSNVTLLLRHDTGTAMTYGTDTYASTPFPDYITGKSASAFGVAGKLKNEVTVNNDITITSKGVIYISGQVSGSQNDLNGASLTTGLHSQITLGTNAKINATNDIYCYGFIAESALDNGSQVNMTSGNITTVYTVVEHRGGAIFGGMTGTSISEIKAVSLQTAAFNRFYLRSVTATLSVSKNATIAGYADLYANDQHNFTVIKLVGYNSSSFIQLGNNSKLTAKFRTDTLKNELHIYGDATINSLSLTVKLSGGTIGALVGMLGINTITLSTEKVMFPISHYWDVNLHKFEDNTIAKVRAPIQNLKVLPGGALTIDEGVTLEVGTLAVYPEEVSASTEYSNLNVHVTTKPTASVYPYNVKTAGLLKVAGTLNVTNFGGKVTAGSPNAIVNISGTNKIQSKELATTTPDGGFMGVLDGCTYRTIELAATGEVFHSSDITSNSSMSAGVTYTGHKDSSGEIGWKYQHSITIKYNSNGGTAVDNRSVNDVWSNSGMVLSSTYLPTTSREHYTFGGWYLDSAFKTAASGKTIYKDQALYAKWNPISYTLNYESVYDGDPPTTSDWPSSGEFHRDMTTAINLTTPTDSNETYTFAGWYTDAACTNKINTESISIDTLFGLLGNGSSVTIYGKWLKESYTFTFDVAYDYISSQLDKPEVTYSLDELALAQWPSIATSYKEAQDKEYYFNGWVYDNGGTKVTLDSMTPAQFVETYGGTDDNKITKFTIEPDMVQKYKLIVNGASGAVGTPITFNKTLYLLNSQIAGAFADCDTQAKAKDSDPATNKYFTKWTKTNASGETITSIDSGMFTNMSLTIQANWGNKYKITYDGGTVVYVKPTASAVLTTPEKTGNTFLGWYTESTGGTKIGDGGASYTPTADINLYSQWERIQYTITVKTNNATVTGVTNGQKAYYGDTITFTVTYSEDNDKTITVKDASGKDVKTTGSYTFTMPASNVTISASSSGCVTPDTLITLADGSQVRVDSLRGDELLLVWNLETGKLDAAPIMFVDSEAMEEFNVVKLTFSDGTTVNVIYEHGFWDYDLNKYVYLDENAFEYIGHTFAKQNGDTLERVTLVDVAIEQAVTTAWSPVTVGHLCYFVNGMLSMPGGVGGLFNIFEVDPNTMTYDYEAMERDIATYGLYTYEELNEIAPLSREMFEAAGGAYMKISIGKGNLTIEELISMIERYSRYFE